MKKNKLYTANKWNRPAFMPEENIFDGFHPVGSQMTFGSGISPDVLGGYKTTAPGMSPQIDWTNGVQRAAVLGTTKGLTEGFSDIANFNNPFAATSSTGSKGGSWLGLSKADNPFSKQNLKAAFGKEGLGNIAKGLGTGLISAGAGMLGNIAGNAISGGLSSTAGNAIGSLGSTIGGAVGMVNPLAGAAVTFASNLVGGTVNRAFGTKVDEAKRNQVNADIAKMNSFTSNAGSFDEIKGPESVSMDTDVYEGGWFSSGDADDKNEELKRRLMAAVSFANRSVDNNIYNLSDDQLNNALANYSALGGPIETMNDENTYDMGGVLGYGLALDLINTKRQNNQYKNQMTNLFAGTPNGLLAFGGDMQTNSADFPTGLTHIDAGKSHEENPNDGVQIGIDQQGIPNLVEEGERIFNNYVFSKRIYADGGTLEKFHLSKKRKITFADLAELLEKEIAERPNDPLSQAGFTKQMEMLEEQQERQKQEMDAQRAKEAFEALSPEEQVAVMENAAQEEQAAQQQAMQEQALAQQGISPEEAAMAQEQMMADGSQPNLGQEPQMACYGGKLFADGGDTKKNIFRALGKATDNDFIKWLEENGLTQLSEGYNDIDWNNILTDDAFISALTKDDAALADAIKKGYSFGAKTPTKDGIVFTDPDRGNWDRQMFEGWNGSKDDAWIELVKAHGVDKLKGMKREDLEKAFKETNAYKNTTKWLQSNPENMRRYLKSVLDTSSSKSAKKHALQFVNEDGTWKNASKIPTYAQIFGENGKGVRETYPGTYWHSVREANIGNRARNLVWNPENEGWDEVVGDVGKDWALDSSYDFYNEKDNLNDRVNYYYRSEGQDDFKPVTAEEAKEAEAAEKMKNFKPKYRKGLFGVDTLGPLAALTMQGLGIGRGDTSVFDAAASGAGNFTTASWMPRGDFMKLKLTDPWRYTMPILANSRATDRAIMNNASPIGTKMAGLLANGYNTTIGLGEAALKGDDVNWQRYVTQKTHDAGVHEDNQREYGVTSRFNAGAYNDAARASANARMQAAAQRFSADRDWYGSLYGNVGNFFGSLTSHKKENDTHNMIADMAANGIFGVITPDSPMGQRYLQWVNSSAEGGKIEKKKNKRRGLTF